MHYISSLRHIGSVHDTMIQGGKKRLILCVTRTIFPTYFYMPIPFLFFIENSMVFFIARYIVHHGLCFPLAI